MQGGRHVPVAERYPGHGGGRAQGDQTPTGVGAHPVRRRPAAVGTVGGNGRASAEPKPGRQRREDRRHGDGGDDRAERSDGGGLDLDHRFPPVRVRCRRQADGRAQDGDAPSGTNERPVRRRSAAVGVVGIAAPEVTPGREQRKDRRRGGRDEDDAGQAVGEGAGCPRRLLQPLFQVRRAGAEPVGRARGHVHQAGERPRQFAAVGQNPRQVAGDQRLRGRQQGQSSEQRADEGAPDVQVEVPSRCEDRGQDHQHEVRAGDLHPGRQGGGVQQAPPRMRFFAQPVRAGQMQRRRQGHPGRLPRQAADDETPGRQPPDGEKGDQEPCAQGAPDADRQDGDGGEVGQTDEQPRGPVVRPDRERGGDEERQQGAHDVAALVRIRFPRDRRQFAGLQELDSGQQKSELVGGEPLAGPEQRVQRRARGQDRDRGRQRPGHAVRNGHHRFAGRARGSAEARGRWKTRSGREHAARRYTI